MRVVRKLVCSIGAHTPKADEARCASWRPNLFSKYCQSKATILSLRREIIRDIEYTVRMILIELVYLSRLLSNDGIDVSGRRVTSSSTVCQ